MVIIAIHRALFLQFVKNHHHNVILLASYPCSLIFAQRYVAQIVTIL